MDNLLFDIRGDDKQLKPALNYLKTIAPGGKAVCYAVVPRKGLVLFWHKPENDTLSFKDPKKEKDSLGIPVKVEIKSFDINWELFVTAWINSANLDDFDLDHWEKEYEDGDVSNGRGFRMTCEKWGHVGESHYAFVLIKPIAAWYGK